MFNVKIKQETFELQNMSFLDKKAFNARCIYPVLGILNQKLLIANPENGEMAELFPRNCIFIEEK